MHQHTVTCSNAPGAGFPVEAMNLSAVPNLAVGSVRRVDTICARHHSHDKDMSATRHAGAHVHTHCGCLYILHPTSYILHPTSYILTDEC